MIALLPPPAKLRRDIRRSIKQVLDRRLYRQSPRIIHSLTMRIQAAAFAIFPARLYTRHILFYYKNQTVKSDSDWDRPQPLDQASFEELQWWYHNIWKWNGRSLLPSSSPSWALDNGRSSTIHQLEGAQSSSSSSEDISSTTELDCLNEENRQYDQPLLYIYKQGGNGSLPLLEELATEVWIWCLQNRIMIQAQYM